MTNPARSVGEQIGLVSDLVSEGRTYDSRREAGRVGEDLVAVLKAEVLGEGLIDQHSPGSDPHGIDILSFDPETGVLRATEVKTVGPSTDVHAPHTAKTVGGRQMDDAYVADRASRQGVAVTQGSVGRELDQIQKDLVQIDLARGTLGVFGLTPDGRVEQHPQEMWNLNDVIAVAQELETAPITDRVTASTEVSEAQDHPTDAVEFVTSPEAAQATGATGSAIGATTGDEVGGGANAGATEADASDASDSEADASDATDSEADASDATDSGADASDATDSGADASDATDSGADASDASDAGADASDAGADASDAGADASDATDSGADASDATDAGGDASGAGADASDGAGDGGGAW